MRSAPGGDGFQVDPASLSGVAGQLGQAYDDYNTVVADFDSAAGYGTGVFGDPRVGQAWSTFDTAWSNELVIACAAIGEAAQKIAAAAQWLAEHLTPDLNNPNTQSSGADWASYDGQTGGQYDVQGWDLYDQGNVGDCVAASTVIAQASVDPLLMLSLTTGYGSPAGGNPPPGDDSPAALNKRLQQIYLQQYGAGQSADGFWANLFGHGEGIGTSGENYLANNDLTGPTGSAYQYQGLNSAADRQAAVPRIQAAVDAGKPVPVDVTGAGGGHQMLIIGHNGNLLEVYNPWGFTEWVTENQFVNGQLGALTGPGVGGSTKNEMPTPDGVELPK